MRVWKQLNRRKTGLVGLIIVVCFVGLAVFAPVLAPYGYQTQNRSHVLKQPSPEYRLGTDDVGRDVLSRVIWGARVSLLAGLAAVGVGLVIGIVMGILAGFYGCTLDLVIVGLCDIVWSFPEILLAIALTAILGPGLETAMVALGLVTWPQYARVIRAQFMELRDHEFVEAARSVGANDLQIAVRHILPNCWSPVIVIASFGMATAILVEATLSYLGLGVQPPLPSWGSILQSGKNFIYQAPLMSIAPGLMIMLVVFGFNMLGDALRDILDPRMRGQ